MGNRLTNTTVAQGEVKRKLLKAARSAILL
jgi:hypothetical protein